MVRIRKGEEGRRKGKKRRGRKMRSREGGKGRRRREQRRKEKVA